MATWHNGKGTLTVEGQDGSVDLEIAASYAARRRGLLGRVGIEGALLITPCGSVHTFRMLFTIDVAYLDRQLQVIDVHTLRPGRMPLPRLGPPRPGVGGGSDGSVGRGAGGPGSR